jgi:hypothetical protein
MSRWRQSRRRLGAGLLAVALLLTMVAGPASMAIDPVWTIDIPLSADRSLLVMVAVRAIPDDVGGSGIVWYDVRLRSGGRTVARLPMSNWLMKWCRSGPLIPTRTGSLVIRSWRIGWLAGLRP